MRSYLRSAFAIRQLVFDRMHFSEIMTLRFARREVLPHVEKYSEIREVEKYSRESDNNVSLQNLLADGLLSRHAFDLDEPHAKSKKLGLSRQDPKS